MKAAYYSGKRTITIGECVPQKPKKGEVRLKVHYCGICGTDLHIFRGDMDDRVKAPQVIGHECSAEIAEIGDGVEGFSVGDRVVVRPLDPCGECPACKAGHAHICQNLKFIGVDTAGAFQSSWTVPAFTLHKLPQNVSMEYGAMIEPLAVACHDVRMGDVKSGEHVVVIGGGPIGMLVSLVARSKGADVMISEVNPYRIKLAKELGVEAVNPKETDLVEYVNAKTGGAGADIVFEVSGSMVGAETMTKLPRTRGRIVVVAIFSQMAKVDLHRFFWRELRLSGARVYEPQDFEAAIALTAKDSIPLSRLITTIAPLSELQQAFESLESNPEAMKVLINCSK